MLGAISSFFTGGRIALIAAAAGAALAVWFYIGRLEAKVERQAATILLQGADLVRAGVITAENARVIERQAAQHTDIVKAMLAAIQEAADRSARYTPAKQEVTRAQPSEIRPLGPAAQRAADRLREQLRANGGARQAGGGPAAAGSPGTPVVPAPAGGPPDRH